MILFFLEFRIVVIDDREEFVNYERFLELEVVVLDFFENILDFLIDENSYIIILIRGYLYDLSVLEWVFKREVGYIGMIGSGIKIGLIYEKFMKKGFKKEELLKVYVLIGIKLNV